MVLQSSIDLVLMDKFNLNSAACLVICSRHIWRLYLGNDLTHDILNKCATFFMTAIGLSLPASTILRYVNIAAKSIVTDEIPDKKILSFFRGIIISLSVPLVGLGLIVDYVKDDGSSRFLHFIPFPFVALAVLLNVVLRIVILIEQNKMEETHHQEREPRGVAIGIIILSAMTLMIFIIKPTRGELPSACIRFSC